MKTKERKGNSIIIVFLILAGILGWAIGTQLGNKPAVSEEWMYFVPWDKENSDWIEGDFYVVRGWSDRDECIEEAKAQNLRTENTSESIPQFTLPELMQCGKNCVLDDNKTWDSGSFRCEEKFFVK